MTDLSRLVQQCLKGKRKYQQELYDRFSGLVMGICLRYSPDRGQAEDVFQEAFIKIYQQLHTVKDPNALPGWIRRVSVNIALDHLKPRMKMDQLQDQDLQQDDGAYESLLDKLTNEELISMINSLPAGYRAVFNLFVIDGYNHKEICQQLGIAESTSRSQLMQAKQHLQKKLKNQGINSYESVI